MKTLLVILTTIFAVVSLVLNWATFMGNRTTGNFGFLSVIITLGLLVGLLLVIQRRKTRT